MSLNGKVIKKYNIWYFAWKSNAIFVYILNAEYSNILYEKNGDNMLEAYLNKEGRFKPHVYCTKVLVLLAKI